VEALGPRRFTTRSRSFSLDGLHRVLSLKSRASFRVSTRIANEHPVRHLNCHPDARSSLSDQAIAVVAAPVLSVEQSDPLPLLDLGRLQPVERHRNRRSVHSPVLDAVLPDDLRRLWHLSDGHRRRIGRSMSGLEPHRLVNRSICDVVEWTGSQARILGINLGYPASGADQLADPRVGGIFFVVV
jgi:hypothetical protein